MRGRQTQVDRQEGKDRCDDWTVPFRSGPSLVRRNTELKLHGSVHTSQWSRSLLPSPNTAMDMMQQGFLESKITMVEILSQLNIHLLFPLLQPSTVVPNLFQTREWAAQLLGDLFLLQQTIGTWFILSQCHIPVSAAMNSHKCHESGLIWHKK